MSFEASYQGNGDACFGMDEYGEIGRRIADAVSAGWDRIPSRTSLPPVSYRRRMGAT